jgi:probable HAF family extracellular repeat protein
VFLPIAMLAPSKGMVFSQTTGSGAFTKIDVPNSTRTEAHGINGSGQIVGLFADAGGGHGFLRDPNGTTFTPIDVTLPGYAVGGLANGINDAGQIVGSYDPGGYQAQRGFLREPSGTVTAIMVPGYESSTVAYGINNSGQVVGYFLWNTGVYPYQRNTLGFLKVGGTYTTINAGAPGTTSSGAYGINNSGQIVGWFTDTSGNHGYLRSAGGAFVTIDVPPAFVACCNTLAAGINDNGRIVGYYWRQEPGFHAHGYVREVDGTFGAIDVPGATDTWPLGINAKNEIVGYYLANLQYHGFLMRRPPVIAIDAGHGNNCPSKEAGGTIGPTWGDTEDNLVLEIARQVASNLNARGYKAVETRPTVRCTGLASRVRSAREDRAVMFVSIHLNSAAKVIGVTPDSCAMWNNKLNPPEEIDKCASGTEVWYDSGGRYAGGSLTLANLVIKNQTDPAPTGLNLSRHGQGIWVANAPKQPFLYILDLAKRYMPAIIDEVAFLSNVGGNETRLNDRAFRTQVANVITDAIVKYYNSP